MITTTIAEQEKTTEKNTTFISVEEMSKMLSIAKGTAYQLTKTKDFPCFYIGKRILIPLSNFNNWVSEQARKQAVFFENRR